MIWPGINLRCLNSACRITCSWNSISLHMYLIKLFCHKQRQAIICSLLFLFLVLYLSCYIDYTSSLIPSVVNFPPSVTITCFTSSVLDDPVALEPDQQFALVIDSITPSSSSIRILVDEVQVTIQDNDGRRSSYCCIHGTNIVPNLHNLLYAMWYSILECIIYNSPNWRKFYLFSLSIYLSILPSCLSVCLCYHYPPSLPPSFPLHPSLHDHHTF